jgi:hypothetical protein
MITLDLSILNQKGTPMFYSDILSARPNFGIAGRIFISTDTYEFYRDTGSAWDLIGGSGTGTITGSGTTGTLSKFTGSSSIGDSIVSETGSALTINGTAKATNWYVGTPSDITRAFAAIGNANNVALWLEEYGNTPNSGDIFMFKGRGTESAKANIQVGDNAGAISTGGYINGNLLTSANWFAEVVNVDTINNHADSDWKLTQSYNSAGFTETFRIRASDGYVTAPNGGFENVLTKTALASEGWYGLSSAEYITIPANISFNNQGFALSTFVGANLMTYQGNATYGNGNGTTSVFGQNGFGFSSAGSTITLNQRSGGTNAFAGVTAFNYTIGSTNGTISHLAGLHVLAPYQVSSAILSVTNYYGALINASNERTAFNITNRWGIYQEGGSDNNYFAAKILVGSTIDNGNTLQITGTGLFTGNVTTNGGNFRLFNGYYLTAKRADGADINVLGIPAGTNDLVQVTSGNWEVRDTGANPLLKLTNLGILGIGTTPSAWSPNYFALQISSNGSLSSTTGGATFTHLTNAAYFDGTNWKYTFTGVSSARYQLTDDGNGGRHSWFTAGSGIAGNSISYTQVMMITGNTNLIIGSTNDPGQKLYLNGSLRIDGQQSATSGGNSGQHLIINLDGTTYKIKLELP